MSITKTTFGRMPDGTPVELYTLTNARRMVARVTPYGATLTELHVPDRAGKVANVVLGFDNLEQYVRPHPFFGCTVGRFANRIARAQFRLDGCMYTLPANDGLNTLHGGPHGLDKKLWSARAIEGGSSSSLSLSIVSPHMDSGFPGELSVQVTYTLTPENELRIDYSATTDRPTPVNLTNHSYFNLAGAGAGNVLDHEMMIAADQYTPVDKSLIPTGELAAVAGGSLDFTSPSPIGSRIDAAGGYDHNYCIRGGGSKLTLAARAREPRCGRIMEVLTTEPGVQFYTGNFLDGSIRGIGGAYRRHFGFCLETQHYPDSPNHPRFPTTILRPAMLYRQVTVYRFTTDT